MTKEDNLVISELRSENFKRIEVVNIKPDGENIVLITGKNGAGKSSVIDSIEAALGGGKSLPDKPVRDGEDSGEVSVKIGNLTVKRSFKNDKSTLTVTSEDGAKYGSPQAMLDEIVGKLSFDPMEFLSLDDKKQREVLLDLLELDVDDIDSKRKEKYDERTEVNRTIKEIEVKVNGHEIFPDVGNEEVSVSDLSAKVVEENNKRSKLKEIKDKASQLITSVDNANKEVEQLKLKILAIEDVTDKNTKAIEILAEQEKAITLGDIEALEKQLDSAEENNEKVRSNKDYALQQDMLLDARSQKESLDQSIKDLDQSKETMIAEADMPVEGLNFGDDSLLYNDIPLKQVNSADQFKVCLAMGMALNPKLKVILFKNGSLLDSESLEYVANLAKDNGYQVWIEKVDETGEVGFVIEEGKVKK